MKKFFLLALGLIMTLGAWAQRPSNFKVYTSFDADAQILEFYYDDQYNSRPNVEYYDPINNPGAVRWQSYHNQVKYVIINQSMKNANLTSMKNMFYGGLYQVENGWDPSKLTNVELVTGLQYLNTANVTNMESMFCGLRKIHSLDLSSFNTSKVTSMKNMFNDCAQLFSIDLSSFDTYNVVDMSYMFAHCSWLNVLDLSRWDFTNLTYVEGMFYNCSNLQTIYCYDNWSYMSNTVEVFNGCTKLKGGNDSSFDPAKITNEYARPDKPGQFGYFDNECPYPIIHKVETTSTTAKVTWSKGRQYEWKFGYKKESEGDETYKYTTVSNPEIELTNLEPNTTYKVYIEGRCGLISYSEGVGTLFTTLSADEGIDEIRADGKATKVIRDGKILIIKGDKTFDILGAEVR